MGRIVAAHVVIALALAACGQGRDPHAALRPDAANAGVVLPAENGPDAPTYYTAQVLQFATLPPIEGGAAFLGDSLIEMARWSEAYPDLKIRNFGVSGDTSAGVLARIDQVIAAQPAKVFIMLGVNDVWAGTAAETTLAAYTEILDRLGAGLPLARVYVHSVLPNTPARDARIRALNAGLARTAAERGAVFVDLYPHFLADGGWLDPRVSMDNAHLTGEGYERWRGLIDAYVRETQGE